MRPDLIQVTLPVLREPAEHRRVPDPVPRPKLLRPPSVLMGPGTPGARAPVGRELSERRAAKRAPQGAVRAAERGPAALGAAQTRAGAGAPPGSGPHADAAARGPLTTGVGREPSLAGALPSLSPPGRAGRLDAGPWTSPPFPSPLQASFLPSELAPSGVKGGAQYYSYPHARRRAADSSLGEWGAAGSGPGGRGAGTGTARTRHRDGPAPGWPRLLPPPSARAVPAVSLCRRPPHMCGFVPAAAVSGPNVADPAGTVTARPSCSGTRAGAVADSRRPAPNVQA